MADVQVMFTGDVNQASTSRLMSEVTTRVAKGARSLLLALSTPGGQVYWGVTAYGFLRGLGIEVITHNIGQVDSIGAAIFLAGDRRLTVGQGRFLIHSIYWTFGADSTLSEKQLSDTLSAVVRDRERVATILSERTGTDLSTVTEHMRDTRILDASEAKTYGFAQRSATTFSTQLRRSSTSLRHESRPSRLPDSAARPAPQLAPRRGDRLLPGLARAGAGGLSTNVPAVWQDRIWTTTKAPPGATPSCAESGCYRFPLGF